MDLTAGRGIGLRHGRGNPRSVVRLEFARGILRASICVKPYRLDDVAVFVPGIGPREFVAMSVDHEVLVLRDLNRERIAQERIWLNMRDFDGFFDGEEDAWKIRSLRSQLEFLAALKTMGRAVDLEWTGMHRIRTLEMVKSRLKFSLRRKGGWLSIRGDLVFDEKRVVSLIDLLRVRHNRVGSFVKFNESDYLKITEALSRQLETLESVGRIEKDAVRVSAAALLVLGKAFDGKGDGIVLPQDLRTRIERVEQSMMRKVDVPSKLEAKLRPYQREGFEWLSRLADCGFGACLADDMGLGKTVQIIALLLSRASEGPSLVVAPASVCGNWRRELNRFAPTLNVRAIGERWAPALMEAKPGDVVIVSYGMLFAHAADFVAREWNGIVLDEAQAIKNGNSRRTRTVKLLKSAFRVAATGTPVENSLTELWSIFDFLNAGLLGSETEFRKKLTVNGRVTERLKQLVAPFILRRTKKEVLSELPLKTEVTIPVVMGKDEAAGYEACRRMAIEELKATAENRISILAQIQRLRRYSCHPSLVLSQVGESAKLETLVELLRRLKAGGHHALVFSQFTDYLGIVRERLEREGFRLLYFDGSTPTKEREQLVERFQSGESDVFLLSLQAGGTGLNLTAADYVILLDPWWNPAVEAQAADRAHRLGQRLPVTVYRLICQNTIEEKVVNLHAEKMSLAEDILADGTSSLSAEAMLGLLST